MRMECEDPKIMTVKMMKEIIDKLHILDCDDLEIFVWTNGQGYLPLKMDFIIAKDDEEYEDGVMFEM